jgi:hypothetical protein
MCYPTRIKVVASVVAGVSAYSLFEHWNFKSLVATISVASALGFVGNERKTQVVEASTNPNPNPKFVGNERKTQVVKTPVFKQRVCRYTSNNTGDNFNSCRVAHCSSLKSEAMLLLYQICWQKC